MSDYPPSMRHVLLDDSHQLLMDDLLIARRDGLTRRPSAIEKYPGNPVLSRTEPFEDIGTFIYGTLLHDEGVYRCWYYTNTHDHREMWCYAESDDGLAWRKPSLGREEFNGSKDNNILTQSRGDYLFKHTYVAKSLADPDPNRRYRAVVFQYIRGQPHGPTRGHYTIFSPDGINWTEPPELPHVRCNENGSLLYDESRADFVDINKTGHWTEMYNREDMRVGHVRCTAVATSDDGCVWSPYRVILTPNLYLDQPFDEFYQLHGFRWGGSYVGLLRVYHNTPQSEPPPRQCIDVQLATSRDGENWQRVCAGDVFIPFGRPREWDFGRIALGNGPPACVGDQMRIYYCGQPTNHRGGDGLGGKGENGLDQGYAAKIGFATCRKDGFVSLDAGDDGGELVTHPIRPGRTLRLNVNAAGGRCLVELQDAAGRAIDGRGLDDCAAIEADGVAAQVAWREGDAIRPGGDGRVRLRISLRNAKLYSWTFEGKPA